jgi:hypothetical protein
MFWFWTGIVLTLVGGLIANSLFRDYFKALCPPLKNKYFDISLIIFLILGLFITTILYLSSQKEVEVLKQKTNPWRLSDSQITELKKNLLKMSPQPIFIACKMMDGDSKDFADSLATLFIDTGWDPGTINESSLDDFRGLRIFSTLNSDGKVKDPSATNYKHLLQVFLNAGISIEESIVRENSIPGLPPNKICIIVGRRPE